MSLRVVEPGLCTLVVDGGRPTTRSLGLPVGGPADWSAFSLGNAMLGNAMDTAALEITLAGPVLQALAPTAAVLLGAPFSMSCGPQRLTINQCFILQPGDELHIGGARHCARAYLCVGGGFQTPLVLGSRSSLTPLSRGSELPCATSCSRRRAIQQVFAASDVPALSAPEDLHALRILPGPEADWFPNDGLGDRIFEVRPESNRMGLRLQGDPLKAPQREMVSQPVAPGAVQITRDGQPILLGVDGQTIGGYPRIAHVISADLDIVGQLRPRDRVRFELVTLEEAERLGRAKRALIGKWCMRLCEAAGAF